MTLICTFGIMFAYLLQPRSILLTTTSCVHTSINAIQFNYKAYFSNYTATIDRKHFPVIIEIQSAVALLE